MVKLQQGNNQTFITVPTQIVRAKGWKKGKELHWKINNKGNLELLEVKV
jgi:hypothetical protein